MVGRDELLGAAEAVAPRLRERARQTELDRRVPDETISDLRAAGLLNVLQPASYGGGEVDLSTFFDVVMALSAADGSVGWVYSVLMVQSWAVAQLDPTASKEVWGSDPSTLVSSATAPRSGYIDKLDDGYRIDGQFGFSSGCHHASWVFVFGRARNAPDEGPTGFLVPRSDYEILDNWNVMGLCGTGSCDVVVRSTVPPHRVHRVAKTGSELSDAPVYSVPFMTVFPHGAAVPLIGTAQGALDDYTASQKDRVRLFAGNVTSEPGTQVRIAESAADIDAARLMLSRNFVELMDAARTGHGFAPELLARADRDRVLATRYAVSAIDRVFANAGARALSLDSAIQRAWRDVHAGAAHPASAADVPLAAYGALAFGLEPTRPF
jgi:3-hydroxy-9,10-secoandrosta-1,3,5(10)-triene-9,17-dione monooxygenase